jgi:hypothetical protein
MNFLPQNYKSPVSSNNYLKMNEGENRIRILSQPIMGWEDWLDNKPVRYRLDAKPARPVDPAKPIRYFWAFIIYNVTEDVIQIMHVTQNTIIKSIEALCNDADWGNPYHYDIKIKKSGKGMETQYVTSPVPHRPVDEHVVDLFNAKPIYLDALFDCADPFSQGQEQYTPFAALFEKPVKVAKKPKTDVKFDASQHEHFKPFVPAEQLTITSMDEMIG